MPVGSSKYVFDNEVTTMAVKKASTEEGRRQGRARQEGRPQEGRPEEEVSQPMAAPAALVWRPAKSS